MKRMRFFKRLPSWLVLGLVACLAGGSAPAFPAVVPKAVLRSSDFVYKGVIKVDGIGTYAKGLAYRRSTNTFFIVGNAGLDPYHLYEIRLPAPNLSWTQAQKTTVVKAWGPLNQNGKLNVTGGGLKYMRGLMWDEHDKRLWFSHGDFYANFAHNPSLGYVTLETGSPVVHGPWFVPASVHSDTTKGLLEEAPLPLQAITGRRFMMFGVKGSVSQQQSWGAGLVSVADPEATGVTSGGTVDAALIVHWPMLSTQANGETVYYSNFPRPFADRNTSPYIHGNKYVGREFVGQARGGSSTSIELDLSVNYSSVNPFPANSLAPFYYVTNVTTGEQLRITAWDNTQKVATTETTWTQGTPASGTPYRVHLGSYEQTVITAPLATFSSEELYHFSWIDLPAKHGVVYFGKMPTGYNWYGHPLAHGDTTPSGAQYQNSIDSLLFPGQKVFDHFADAFGTHSESSSPRWYILDPNAVLTAAQKVKDRTATSADLQVGWATAGDLHSLGGTVVIQDDQITAAEDHYWDAANRDLYVLFTGLKDGSNLTAIHVWHVTDDVTVVPASIIEPPRNKTIAEGERASFSVSVIGTPPIQYLWRKNGQIISGANSQIYETPPTTKNDDGAQFTCTVTNGSDPVTSEPATLTVTSSSNGQGDEAIVTPSRLINFAINGSAAFASFSCHDGQYPSITDQGGHAVDMDVAEIRPGEYKTRGLINGTRASSGSYSARCKDGSIYRFVIVK